TNDLTQYSLAVDRGNESVAQLYSYYHPAVLRLIKASIFGAHKNGIPCGMCGEAAGDLLMLPVLIGMGLDEYSMTASSIPEIKERVGKLSVKGCEELAEKVLACSSKTEVERELKTFQSYIK
ncbi:MAG TPA: phosphoenolpyruvate--protein phosphotransferase, partial [Lachnospiraceae bacterium]|nr:phosphoenolpyruvate--protein phosphotransferase [Lachnospiraceae bacterium]